MTGAAPSLLTAWTVTTNSGRFEVMTATRSPRPTPCARQVLRQGVGGPVQLSVRPAIVSGQDGDVIGVLLGGRFEPLMHEARCHGETFFSELRFSVNTNEVYGYQRHEQPEHRGDRRGRPVRDHRHRPALRGARGHPGGLRPRAFRHLPRGHRRADAGPRALRRHHPRGVRRPRPGPVDVHRDHRGTGLRLDEPDRHRQHPHHGRHHDHHARHGGAETALAPRHGVGRAARRALALRARRRERHPQHFVPGPARRGRVRRSTAPRPG